MTKADVQAFLSAASGATEATGARGAQRAPVARETSVASFEDRPLTAMRRVTAARLQQAKQTIPHFYLETDCRADALLDVRKQINESSADLKVTLTDLLVLACAVALRRVPEANSEWIDGALRVHESVDIAVAVNTPQGLITPVIRGCQRKPLATISRELKELSERARGGRLKPEEYTNGTFTLSNLGMFGVTRITPIVNPPQSCILGIGAVESRPVVVDGGVVPGRVMGCTLAADHRAVDGALGAQLLQEIRRLIEQPLTMMIGV